MSTNQLTKKLVKVRNLLDEGKTGIEKERNGKVRSLSRKERSKKLNEAIWIVNSVLEID